MGVFFHLRELDSRQTVAGRHDAGEHGRDRRDAEDQGDDGDGQKVRFRRRVHDERDERFARAEDEDGEEYPGRQIGGLFAGVDVGVPMDVRVRVRVFLAVGVDVAVGVRLAADGAVDAPDEIQEAERDQEPGGQIATDGFDRFEPKHDDAQTDADEAEDDRTDHVPDAAQRRHRRGPRGAPASGLRHGDEGEIVVRSEDRVDKSNRRGGARQQERFVRHNVFPFRL